MGILNMLFGIMVRQNLFYNRKMQGCYLNQN